MIKEAKTVEVIETFDKITENIRKVSQKALVDWANSIENQIEDNLELCLLIRNQKNKELYLNFKPQLSGILREVHYLKLMNITDIPEKALKLAERNEIFRKYISNLNSTIAWYNKIRRTTKNVEFDLIKNEIGEIDGKICLGQTGLNWNSNGIIYFFSDNILLAIAIRYYYF